MTRADNTHRDPLAVRVLNRSMWCVYMVALVRLGLAVGS